jgi:DNA-binding XRE family transcriptional regulator
MDRISSDDAPPHPGALVRAARRRRDWTQAELGRRLGGISRARVAAIEAWGDRGRPTPAWFAQHAAVWDELGIAAALTRALLAGHDACPLCRRPL